MDPGNHIFLIKTILKSADLRKILMPEFMIIWHIPWNVFVRFIISCVLFRILTPPHMPICPDVCRLPLSQGSKWVTFVRMTMQKHKLDF